MVKAIDVYKTHKTMSVMITIALFDKRFRDKIFSKIDLIYYSSINIVVYLESYYLKGILSH